MRFNLSRFALVLSFGALPLLSASTLVRAQESEKPSAETAEADTDVAEQEEDQPDKPKLTIGSKAPSIDIEYWMQKGDDQGQISDFEQGKVYVVEFWATWCPPCVASMPHLAQLQKEYKDKNLRIISVSNEDLEVVEKFLDKKVPNNEEELTFGELTSAYSLTTDPDQSVYTDYMEAAQQNGIPTAFVVGKTGEIEWIGHPMSMDPVLEQVVDGSWDRAAYAKQMEEEKADEAAMMEAARLFRSDETEKAVKLLDERLAKAKAPLSVLKLSSILVQFSGDDESSKAVMQNAADRLEKVTDDAEEMLKPYVYDFRSRLVEKLGDLDTAIELEQQAIKLAESPLKEQMISRLETLRNEKNPPKDDEGSDESKKDK